MSYHVLWQPNPGPQTAFLQSTAREVLYGGAVGGGKTDALLALPLRWATHPKFSAIYFRRERKNAQETVDRMRALYSQLLGGDYWHETEMRFRLPAGGFINVGYAELEKDIEKWKSFEFPLIIFDELTEFTAHQYTFMLSRNRAKSADLPLMMRSATNPGGDGMAWVMDYFPIKQPWEVHTHRPKIEGYHKPVTITRQFIPSTVFDNPKLPNRDSYLAGLASIPDEAMREAMMYGRWDRFTGQYFMKGPRECKPGVKSDLGEWYVIRCMDYGWTDPTCVMWLVVYPEANRIEIAAELYGAHMTTDSIAHMVREIEKEHRFAEKVRYSVLSPDAVDRGGREGAQSIGSLLGQAGVWFQRANNDRVSGWAQVLRLIESDQLQVWEGRAPHLARTLTRLPRDPNRPNDIRRKNVEDHAAEALRYGCMAYYSPPEETADTAGTLIAPAAGPNRDRQFDRLVEHIMNPKRDRDHISGLGAGW